jgi:hypothetical protein
VSARAPLLLATTTAATAAAAAPFILLDSSHSRLRRPGGPWRDDGLNGVLCIELGHFHGQPATAFTSRERGVANDFIIIALLVLVATSCGTSRHGLCLCRHDFGKVRFSNRKGMIDNVRFQTPCNRQG